MLRHIMERHVAEIDALWSRRRQVQVSPTHLVADRLAIDRRVGAHVHALVAGGATCRALLQDYPTDGDRDATFAASYPLLLGGDQLAREGSVQRLAGIARTALPGLRDAWMHAPLTDLAPRVRRLLEGASEHRAVAAGLILAAHGELTEADWAAVGRLFVSADAAVRAAAWRVPRYTCDFTPPFVPDVEQFVAAFQDTSVHVHDSALCSAAWCTPHWLLRDGLDAAGASDTAYALRIALTDPLDEATVRTILHGAAPSLRIALMADSGLGAFAPDLIEYMRDAAVTTRVAAGIAYERITGHNVDGEETALLHDAPNDVDEFEREFLPSAALPDAVQASVHWSTYSRRRDSSPYWNRGVSLAATASTPDLRAVDVRAFWSYRLRQRLRDGPGANLAQLTCIEA